MYTIGIVYVKIVVAGCPAIRPPWEDVQNLIPNTDGMKRDHIVDAVYLRIGVAR